MVRIGRCLLSQTIPRTHGRFAGFFDKLHDGEEEPPEDEAKPSGGDLPAGAEVAVEPLGDPARDPAAPVDRELDGGQLV